MQKLPHKDRPRHWTLQTARHTHSCQTERDDEIAILATVNLADHTGEIERILVDEQNLQALAAVASKEQLLTL